MEPIRLPPTCAVTHANGVPCSVHKELEDAEYQIIEAEKLVALLKSKRTRLKSTLNALNDPISRRLPFEIASHIFQLYLEVQVEFADPGAMFPKPSMTDAPFRLGAVCRKWREIAWALPALWTSFSICLYPLWTTNMLRLAKEWLGHTGSFPLSIRIYERDPGYEYSDEETGGEEYDSGGIYERVIDVVNSVSSRWQSLDVEANATILFKIGSCDNRKNPGPSVLQKISLNQTSDIWDEFFLEAFPRMNPGHSPTHLCLTDISAEEEEDLDNWTNSIVSFEAHLLSIEDCLLIIRALPGLQDLIFGQTTRNSPGSPRPAITHSGLRTLRFLETSKDSINILERSILPSLQTFSSDDESHILNSLISLIGRSSCHLISLRLDSCRSSNHELRNRLLQSTPFLNTLILNFESEEPQNLFLQSLLKMKFDNSTLLPNLKTFMTKFNLTSDLLFRVFPTLSDVLKRGISISTQTSHVSAILQVLSLLTGDMFYTENDTLQGFIALIARGFYISINRDDADIDSEIFAFHFPPAENP